MQSRTHGDTTNRIVAALRVVFVGIRILNLSLKSAPQKNDLTRVCLRSHNSAKKQRNRLFSRSYTIWDMSVDTRNLFDLEFFSVTPVILELYDDLLVHLAT